MHIGLGGQPHRRLDWRWHACLFQLANYLLKWVKRLNAQVNLRGRVFNVGDGADTPCQGSEPKL